MTENQRVVKPKIYYKTRIVLGLISQVFVIFASFRICAKNLIILNLKKLNTHVTFNETEIDFFFTFPTLVAADLGAEDWNEKQALMINIFNLSSGPCKIITK